MEITNRLFILKNKKSTIAILLFLINFLIKTYKIEKGNRVVWDEAHFGKFSSRYLKREFYFDVHPPLGKMMTALSGYLFNQDVNFKFESGTNYPETMDYVGMRRFHAFVASFIPVFSFLILLELKYNYYWCFLISLLYVFENGMCSISRLILLDSHLLFFTGSTAYCLTRFYSRKRFESLNLLFLGISLGCVMSVKWIGCLTTTLVGIYVIFELWRILMSRKKILVFAKKFALRSIFLIFIPIALYCFWFFIHFIICNTSTSDDAHMSSLFQAHLKNGSLQRIKKYVPFGSIVSIKSSKIAGGNLHSHNHNYPDTDLKQITTYFHKDSNNHFAFQKVIEDGDNVDYLRDNDEVVLFHVQTKTYLSSDLGNAYLSKGKRVVGISGNILQSCIWIVEIAKDDIKREDKVKSITTKFRLRNKERGWYLNWSGKNYPQWGFSQGEVTCVDNQEKGTLWNIEENKYSEDETHEEYLEIKDFKNTFLTHVIEINKAMYNSNKALTQEPNLEPVRIVSKPYEWFIMNRGLRMNHWGDDNIKFYMFGNPLIWYLATICILLSPVILLSKVIYKKRYNLKIDRREYFEVFLSFGGWSIHYLPFYLIGRVLYFHHYFPALFFAILGIHYVFKHLPLRYIETVIIISSLIFTYFSEMNYGIVGPASALLKKKWIKSWDFV